MIIFVFLVLLFIFVSVLSHQHVKSQYGKRIQELENRHQSLERNYEKLLQDFERERSRAGQIEEEASELKARLNERESLIRRIFPSRKLTPLEVVRIKGLASESEIKGAKDQIVRSGELKEVEDVLVERGKLTREQLEELREIASRFNAGGRQSRMQ